MADPVAPTDAYPIRFDLPRPERIANWRPLVHWLLAIPQLIVAGVLQAVAGVIVFIGFFAVIFTRRWPASLLGFLAMTYRYSMRTTSYALFLREPYPPFEFDPTLDDRSGDPAAFDVDDPGEMHRFAPLYQWILAIPHHVILFFLFIAAYVVALIGFFAVLFTGRWPDSLARFMIGVGRWYIRVQAYTSFMTNRYPPFSLD